MNSNFNCNASSSNSNEQIINKPINSEVIKNSTENQSLVTQVKVPSELVTQKQPGNQQPVSSNKVNTPNAASTSQPKPVKQVAQSRASNIQQVDTNKTQAPQQNKQKQNVSRVNPAHVNNNQSQIQPQQQQQQSNNNDLLTRISQKHETPTKERTSHLSDASQTSMALLHALKIDKNFITRTVN